MPKTRWEREGFLHPPSKSRVLEEKQSRKGKSLPGKEKENTSGGTISYGNQSAGHAPHYVFSGNLGNSHRKKVKAFDQRSEETLGGAGYSKLLKKEKRFGGTASSRSKERLSSTN